MTQTQQTHGRVEVQMVITDEVGWDTTGTDVPASMDRYTEILEQQTREQYGEWISVLHVTRQHEPVLGWLDLYPDPDEGYVTPEQERELRENLVLLADAIAAGGYGDWSVPAEPV